MESAKSPFCRGLFRLLLLLSSVASLWGCRAEEPRRGTGAASFLELDQEVTQDEAAVVSNAVEVLARETVKGSNVRWYSEVFGDESSGAPLQFLAERVQYILSQNTDIQSRVRINADPVVFRSERFREEDDSGRGATNLSSLWFLRKSVEPEKLQFEINGRLLPVETTRIGIVQLGPAFLKVPRLIQAGVLVHEARHSDCTGGLWQSDIERVRRGEDPLNLSCGHLHVVCPSGHAYSGLYACDREPWGAYSVNLLYFSAVEKACVSCSEEDRVLADAAAVDAASRLLISPSAMLAGSDGPPNMSSSTEVVDR